jgi:transposase
MVIGVDTHKDTFAAAVVDELGSQHGCRSFANCQQGYEELLEWAKLIRSSGSAWKALAHMARAWRPSS